MVGLFLIGAFFHSLLGLFGPRLRLKVSSGAVPLGGTLELGWKFSGQISRLQRLRIYLEGTEEATYRQGTTTQTEKHVFAALAIANLTSRMAILSGEGKLTLPVNSMHSFEGRSNRIRWTIHVRGEIPRWPDLEEEFALQVLPLPK